MKKISVVMGVMLALTGAACDDDVVSKTEDAAVPDSSVSDATLPDASVPDADVDDAGDDASVTLGPTCTTTVGAGSQNLELCRVDGTVQHVRIAGVTAVGEHASS